MPTSLDVTIKEELLPKANPIHRIKLSWKCQQCGEMNQDDTATECSHCHAKRKY